METTRISALSKTLFIPLAARAKETENLHPIVSDLKAAEIMNQVNTNGILTDGGEISTLGILARTAVIDCEVQKILAQNPSAVIINLGAGLDTRISRLDNGIIRWYDLDFPEVITLRRQFFCENERVRYITKSVLDVAWPDEISVSDKHSVIIIAEGLLMYLNETDIKFLFKLLSKYFPGAHMFFDVIHGFFVKKKISSTFLWGINHASDIEKLNPNIRLIQSWSMGNLLKDRQSFIYRLLNIFPSTRNRSQIMQIQFRQK